MSFGKGLLHMLQVPTKAIKDIYHKPLKGGLRIPVNIGKYTGEMFPGVAKTTGKIVGKTGLGGWAGPEMQGFLPADKKNMSGADFWEKNTGTSTGRSAAVMAAIASLIGGGMYAGGAFGAGGGAGAGSGGATTGGAGSGAASATSGASSVGGTTGTTAAKGASWSKWLKAASSLLGQQGQGGQAQQQGQQQKPDETVGGENFSSFQAPQQLFQYPRSNYADVIKQMLELNRIKGGQV